MCGQNGHDVDDSDSFTVSVRRSATVKVNGHFICQSFLYIGIGFFKSNLSIYQTVTASEWGSCVVCRHLVEKGLSLDVMADVLQFSCKTQQSTYWTCSRKTVHQDCISILALTTALHSYLSFLFFLKPYTFSLIILKCINWLVIFYICQVLVYLFNEYMWIIVLSFYFSDIQSDYANMCLAAQNN